MYAVSYLKKYGAHLLVFLLPVIIYSPTLLGTFYYDDNSVFFGHQVKYLAEHPLGVFESGSHALPGVPRSLHVFILLIVYKLFGAAPLPYHLLNLVLHGIVSLLTYLFVRIITAESEYLARIALVTGLLFGLHPIHVENITFVTLGGTDLLMTLFSVLSLILYVDFRRNDGGKRYAFLFFSMFAYFLSLLSKEAAIGFLLAFPLTELLIEKKGFRWTLPYLLVLLAAKWDIVAGIPSLLGKPVVMGATGKGKDYLALLDSLGYTLKALLLPYPQSVIIREFGPQTPTFLFIAACVVVAIVCFRFVRPRRLLLYALSLLLVTSLPYLFVPFAEGNIAVFAERYVYAASVGFCLFVSIVAVGLLKDKKRLAAAILIVCTAYSFEGVSFFYHSWRTEKAFWRNAVAMNPDNIIGYFNLAMLEKDQGNLDESTTLLSEALRKKKGTRIEFAYAAYNIGLNKLQMGRYSDAESYFLYSLQFHNLQFPYVSLGFLYLDLGRIEKAKWAFENALAFVTPSSRSLYGLAKCYALLGNMSQARRYAEEAYRSTTDPGIRNLAAELLR